MKSTISYSKRKILSMVVSLMMIISMIPGMVFADTAAVDAGNTAVKMQLPDTLEDYTELQKGTQSTRIYMLNCSTFETVFPDEIEDAPKYESRWTIKVNTSEDSFFDNYILETPDSKEEIEFVYSIGGSGMNRISTNPVDYTNLVKGIREHTQVLNKAGEPQNISIEDDDIILVPQKGGSGGGGGLGPNRAVDVVVKIAPNTLNANETYKLALTEGLGYFNASRNQLDKEIYFTFTTAPILVESITLDSTDLTLEEGESATLGATVAPEDATDKTLVWTSSDESIATVDENGKVTAVAEGEASIIASANVDDDPTVVATMASNSVVTAECNVTVTAATDDRDPDAAGGKQDNGNGDNTEEEPGNSDNTSNEVQTGDDFSAMLPITLMLLAVLGGAVALKVGRRKSGNTK